MISVHHPINSNPQQLKSEGMLLSTSVIMVCDSVSVHVCVCVSFWNPLSCYSQWTYRHAWYRVLFQSRQTHNRHKTDEHGRSEILGLLIASCGRQKCTLIFLQNLHYQKCWFYYWGNPKEILLKTSVSLVPFQEWKLNMADDACNFLRTDWRTYGNNLFAQINF